MIKKRTSLLLAGTISLAALSVIWAQAPQGEQDTLLRAMKDEMERSRSLKLANLDSPYYFEYAVDDTQSFSAIASLGGLMSSRQSAVRLPRVQVRVGKPEFDNTDYIYTDFFGGSRFENGSFPVENSYEVMRRQFWLGTDRAFKGAVESITRKRAALRNLSVDEQIPDFTPLPGVQKILPLRPMPVDQGQWNTRVRSLSRVFVKYPDVLSSLVTFDSNHATYYYTNSEGTMLRLPDDLAYLRVNASGLAPDGSRVRDSMTIAAPVVDGLPNEAEMRRQITEVAEHVSRLVKAPVGEEYSGPVLFEGVAGAQVFAELLASNLALTRKPLSEPGRPIPIPQSEFEGRINARVMPEFLDVIDDPTQTSRQGRPLIGSYPIDYEGVIPQPLTLIEKGKLKGYLLTRQPIKTFRASNGRARLPGNFGAHTAVVSNLFVRNNEPTSEAELKQRLIQMCKERSKPYGLLVRKMDYPSTASQDELRQIAANSNSGGRSISLPLLTYKVYLDGHEELVRGLRFRSVNARSLKDIVAASDKTYQFDYLFAPAVLGGSGYVAPVSVIAPTVLFDDVEVDRLQLEQPKPPIVAPPPVSTGS